MFSQVFVCPQGVCPTPLDADNPWMQTPQMETPPPRCRPPDADPPGILRDKGQQAGGTHPTGMHSCFRSTYFNMLLFVECIGLGSWRFWETSTEQPGVQASHTRNLTMSAHGMVFISDIKAMEIKTRPRYFYLRKSTVEGFQTWPVCRNFWSWGVL